MLLSVVFCAAAVARYIALQDRRKRQEKKLIANIEIKRNKHRQLDVPKFHRVEIENIITLVAICTLPNLERLH